MFVFIYLEIFEIENCDCSYTKNKDNKPALHLKSQNNQRAQQAQTTTPRGKAWINKPASLTPADCSISSVICAHQWWGGRYSLSMDCFHRQLVIFREWPAEISHVLEKYREQLGSTLPTDAACCGGVGKTSSAALVGTLGVWVSAHTTPALHFFHNAHLVF